MFTAGFRLRTLCVPLLSVLLSTVQAVNFQSGNGAQNEETASVRNTVVYSEYCDQPDESTLAAIVRVATDQGSIASGVVYERNRVLTAAHAIRGAAGFFVQIDGSYIRADLILVDHIADLAVLAVYTGEKAPVRILELDVIRSETLWAVGYPGGQAIRADTGTLQRVDNGVLYTSAPVDSGQSGGGLLLCHEGVWSVVGMLRGYGAAWQRGRYVRMRNYSAAVAAETINDFFRQSN